MLRDVARQLDAWVVSRNAEAQTEGLPSYPPCEIRVIGQAALLEAGCELAVVATADVDVSGHLPFAVEQEFRRLLATEGLELDPVGHEAWMPPETEHTPVFSGRFVTLLVADEAAILVSKAIKAPERNRALIVEYLARGASERFLELARRHSLDLEQFL